MHCNSIAKLSIKKSIPKTNGFQEMIMVQTETRKLIQLYYIIVVTPEKKKNEDSAFQNTAELNLNV